MDAEFPVTGARSIVLHDDSVLLMERRKAGLHYFVFPGGHVESAETPEAALLRELREETTLNCAIERLLYIARLEHRKETQLYYLTRLRGVRVLPELSTESAEYQLNAAGIQTYRPQWVKITDLDKVNCLPAPIARQFLRDMVRGLPSVAKEIVVTDVEDHVDSTTL